MFNTDVNDQFPHLFVSFQAFDVVESELPFCKAVVLETLRMHPSVMKQMKSAVEDDVLPDGTRVRQLSGFLFFSTSTSTSTPT